ncbi:hypothetical protein M8R20_16540 [Pseudomonas sp. R2.Fl]|nr:hypothetical protein [Pseudomonas sp. R2.Fl]
MSDRDRVYVLLRKALEIAWRDRHGMLAALIVLAINENITGKPKGGAD